MQVFITLTRRELGSIFCSMAGYIIIAGAVFLMGLSFVSLLMMLQGEAMPIPITQLFYNTGFFWEILLLASPLITMRLFAHEKFSGTFETLMTAPVSDLEVVLSKFTAAMVFFAMLWLPSLGSILILHHFMSRPETFDPGLLCSTTLATHLSLFDHMTEFSRGTVDTRHIVFYLTSTIFFLFLTLRTVESRRWK